MLSVKFQRASAWFIVEASEEELEISWANSEDALKEDGWKVEGGRIERVYSRTIGLFYIEKPANLIKLYGQLSYEGPEIKVPTRTFTMPANTKEVIQQIEKSLETLRKL